MRLLAIGFAAACAFSTLAIADDSQDEARAWSELSEARAVLLLRHTSAPGIGDPPGFVLEECRTQRNLNDVGKGEARRWGELLKRKDISQPRLLSSRWCRCLETGSGMGLTEVEPFPLLDSFFVDSKRNVIQTDGLRAFLNEYPSPAPVVLITHQVNITAFTGIFPRSGEGLILELPITDPVTVLARIPPP
jgi:hypothetical protein